MKHMLWALGALVLTLAGAGAASASTCSSLPYTLTNGQTADATQVMSDLNSILTCVNTNVATSGANSNITSLSGITTPLSASQGGTGQSTSIFSSNNSWSGTQAISGVATFSAAPVFSVAPTFSTALTFSTAVTHNAATTFNTQASLLGSTSSLAALTRNIQEVATIAATAATGTINYDVTTQSVLYYTSNAAANWTLNIRGNSGATLASLLSTGQAITVAHLVTQGATAFYNSVVQVDGTTTGVTTVWLSGAPTAGGASGIDAYTYTVIKTGSATYTVLATQASFS